MNNSNLYRIHPENKILQNVEEINFSDFNFQERYDIQEWVESTPDILGEELLIIAKEKSCFEGTKERPDLIALDKEGNIVIVELKRDDSGVGVEWQAIKYASYWSKFKVSDIINIYIDYLKRKKEEIDEERAKQIISDFIDEDSVDILNKKQRIILVSHRYAKEVISAVNWLINGYDMDIKCVQLIPYYDADRETHYLQKNIILPVAGIDDLIVKASGSLGVTPQKKSTSGPVRKDDDITYFFEKMRDMIYDELDTPYRPTKHSRWAGVGDRMRYYHFWYKKYLWENWQMSYKIWIFSENHYEKDRRNKFAIYLDFSKKYLLNKGVTEKKLSDLILYLKNISDLGFEYKESDTNIWLAKFIENDNFSEDKIKELSSIIKSLITKTKSDIEEILKKTASILS